jgi:hypothetical protein
MVAQELDVPFEFFQGNFFQSKLLGDQLNKTEITAWQQYLKGKGLIVPPRFQPLQ